MVLILLALVLEEMLVGFATAREIAQPSRRECLTTPRVARLAEIQPALRLL